MKLNINHGIIRSVCAIGLTNPPTLHVFGTYISDINKESLSGLPSLVYCGDRISGYSYGHLLVITGYKYL